MLSVVAWGFAGGYILAMGKKSNNGFVLLMAGMCFLMCLINVSVTYVPVP